MHFLIETIGPPLFRINRPEGSPAAVITTKGIAVCDPGVVDTGSPSREDGDPGERCVLYRGHIHIRQGPCHSVLEINPASRWLVILPFHDLPKETAALFRRALPADSCIPRASVKILKSIPALYKTDRRRLCRLRDALAQAGLPSPVTLVPTRLHSRPLKIYPKIRVCALPLPTDEKLSAIIENWSGAEEFIEFSRPLPGALPDRGVRKNTAAP